MTRVSSSPTVQNKLLVDLSEAAERLGISPRKLWELTSPRGSIKCLRIGRAVRYSLVTLEQWIADQEARTAGKGAFNG